MFMWKWASNPIFQQVFSKGQWPWPIWIVFLFFCLNERRSNWLFLKIFHFRIQHKIVDFHLSSCRFSQVISCVSSCFLAVFRFRNCTRNCACTTFFQSTGGNNRPPRYIHQLYLIHADLKPERLGWIGLVVVRERVNPKGGAVVGKSRGIINWLNPVNLKIVVVGLWLGWCQIFSDLFQVLSILLCQVMQNWHEPYAIFGAWDRSGRNEEYATMGKTSWGLLQKDGHRWQVLILFLLKVLLRQFKIKRRALILESLCSKMICFVVIQLHVRWLFEDYMCSRSWYYCVYIDVCTDIMHRFFLKRHDACQQDADTKASLCNLQMSIWGISWSRAILVVRQGFFGV